MSEAEIAAEAVIRNISSGHLIFCQSRNLSYGHIKPLYNNIGHKQENRDFFIW